MCTSYTVFVVLEEQTHHTRGVGRAFMQTVEWEESKKKVVETSKFKKSAEPGRDGAGVGPASGVAGTFGSGP